MASKIPTACRALLGCTMLWTATTASVASAAVGSASQHEATRLGVARLVNSFPLKSAAVAAVAPGGAAPGFPGNKTGLVLTSFNFGKGDGVWAIPNAGQLIDEKGSQPTINSIDSTQPWPNQADLAPAGAIAGKSVVLEAGGFFPNPTKATGTVVLIDVTSGSESPTSWKISTDKSGYFYHHAVWHDINGDGLLDVVAARAHVPTIPISKDVGELIWLQQPQSDPLSTAWKHHVLISPAGPDVSFYFGALSSGGEVAVIATQFFDAKQLAVFRCKAPSWSQCNSSNGLVESIVIDSTIGPFFNLELVDLNGDGKPEVLTTTNRNDGKGGLYAYEIPAEPFSAAWPRHTLATGFKPITPWLPGQGGPGTAKAFKPDLRLDADKPSILLSGDDNGTVTVLTPLFDSASDWQYNISTLCVGSGTVGTPAVGDLNGDLFTDFAITMFADNRVDIYTYAPPL